MNRTYNDYDIQNLVEKVDSIEEYRKNNPECDPNAYEMVEVLSNYNAITNRLNKSQSSSIWTNEEFKSMHSIVRNFIDTRKSQFIEKNNGLRYAKESALYNYFENTFPTFSTGGVSYNLEDENVKNICAKTCGINLYVQQQVRDNLNNSNNIVYDNFNELHELEQKIQKSNIDSRALEAIEDLRNENKIAYNKTPEQYISDVKNYYKNKEVYLETKEEYERSMYDDSIPQEKKDELDRMYNAVRIIHFEELDYYTKNYREKEKNISERLK